MTNLILKINLNVGDPINTDHGTGIVIGFERFDRKGKSAPMGDVFRGKERIIIKLDEGHTWCFEGSYALFAHEYAKFNNTHNGEWRSIKHNPPTVKQGYLTRYSDHPDTYRQMYFRPVKLGCSDSQWCVDETYGQSWQGKLPDEWFYWFPKE